MDLSQYNGKIICQKDAFLAAAKGVSIGIEFQRKLGAGFFGGEGFIMQKLEGDGMAFVHAGGTIIEYKLDPGEILRVDTGCLVAMTQEVNYNIEMVKGVKTALFGGEGLFFATLKGPGTVWIQSFHSLDLLAAYLQLPHKHLAEARVMKAVLQVDCLIYLAGNNCVNKWGCPFSRYFNDNGMALFFVITISDKYVFEVVAFLHGLVSEEFHSNKIYVSVSNDSQKDNRKGYGVEITKQFLSHTLLLDYDSVNRLSKADRKCSNNIRRFPTFFDSILCK